MKTIKIIPITLALLFLIGCSGLRSDKYTPSITSKDIYTGKDGLSMGFFENAPPKEILENGILPIWIKLQNKGAYNIAEGYISLNFVIPEKDYLTIDQNSLSSIYGGVRFTDPNHISFTNLNGKSIERPKGDEELITFTADVNDFSKDPQSKLHKSLISITSCYGYQTKLTQTVCIESSGISALRNIQKSCKAQTINPDSQGAPIAVTKVESNMIPDKDNPSLIKPRFTITIKNLGNGEAITQEKVEASCSSGHGNYTLNAKVYLSTMEDSNQLDCDPSPDKIDGAVKLNQKEGSIICYYEPGFDESKGTFSTVLYVILDYGYIGTISKEITIKKRLGR